MTIDEILATLPEPAAEGEREYLVIDPATRSIAVPDSERLFGVTGDELAARKYFLCPRFVGNGLDLAGMFLTVYFRNANNEVDGYAVTDVAVEGDYITFSWELSEKVTKYMGPVQFNVCADLPNTDKVRRPDWNTTTASGECLEGLHPDIADVTEESSDLATQLRAQIAASTAAVAACGAEQVEVVKNAAEAETAAAVAAVQAQGKATKESIPADYSTLAATVDRLSRDRAGAIVCQAAGAAIQVQDASNDPLQGLRIFGRSTQDGVPTPENPVEIVSTEKPVVTVCGKNLWDEETELGYWQSANGEAYMADNQIRSKNIIPIAPNITIYFTAPNNKVIDFVFYDRNKSFLSSRSLAQKITSPDDAYYMHINLRSDYGPTYNNDVCISLSALDGVYVPYARGQRLAIATPGSLPGIPVASGGNYTDENGQQWICDEVDLARGVYVQRVHGLTFNGTENWTLDDYNGTKYLLLPLSILGITGGATGDMCTHATHATWCAVSSLKGDDFFVSPHAFFSLSQGGNEYTSADDWKTYLATQYEAGTPVEILYARATPAETVLTDAEVQAFRALHSCKGNTTVLNDAGAHMVLEYAADPKTYIDNKIAALVAANN